MNLGDILQLGVRINATGVDDLDRTLQHVEGAAHEAAEAVSEVGGAAKEAGGEFGRFRAPILEAFFAAEAFKDELKETLAVLGEISGVKVASEYRKLQISLENVTGSAKEAKEMMEALENVGLNSPYNTQQVVALAPQLMNSGMSSEGAVRETKAITNIAALGNLGTDQFAGFAQEMVKMRSTEHPMVRELARMGNVPWLRLVNAGAGTNFKNSGQAIKYLETQSGVKAADVLEKGAEALGPMAAAMMLMRDPAAALAKGFELLEEVMKPTGDLILDWVQDLAPLWKFLGGIVLEIKHLNEVTGGSAGLLFILMGVRRASALLADTFFAAIRFTQELTEAVREYGHAAEEAALGGHMGRGGGGVAEEAKGVAEAGKVAKDVGYLGRMAGWLKGMKDAAVDFQKNPLEKVTAWLKGLKEFRPLEALNGLKGADMLKGLKLAKIADIFSFAADLGLHAMADHMRQAHGGGTLGSDVVAGIGEGVGWGGLGGPWGALAGAVVGGIGGIIYHNKNAKEEGESGKEDAERRHTDAIDRNTAALEMHGKVMGGGSRARGVGSQIETEYAVARMMSMGYAS